MPISKLMPVFHLGPGRTPEPQPESSLLEDPVRALFEEHGLIFIENGLRLVDHEMRVRSGRVDTFALDESNRPVVIEYKIDKDEASGALVQALAYTNSIRDDEDAVDRLIRRKLQTLPPNTEIDFENTRIVLVAPEFDQQVLEAARLVEPTVRLVRYRIYDGPHGHTITTEAVFDSATARRSRSSVGSSNDEWTWEDKWAPIGSVFRKLVSEVSRVTGASPKYTQEYVAFRHTKNFAMVWAYVERLDVGLYLPEALNPPYQKPPSDWRPSRVTRLVPVRSESEVNEELAKWLKVAFDNS